MKRLIAALLLLTASPALAANTPALTLTNLKTPVARICRATPAKSVAELWRQLDACSPIAAPVPTTPTPTPSTPVIVSEGDSISVRMAATHIAAYADSHRDVPFHGNAVGGSAVRGNGGNDLDSRLPADLGMKPTVVTLLIGANDMTSHRDIDYTGAGRHPAPDAWLASLWGYVGQVKASGARVALGTLLPQCYPSNALFTAAFNQRRGAVNAAIRAALGSRIDAVIDYAADPAIGDDADACDPAVFYDGLHPTTAAQSRMYALYRPAVEALVAHIHTPAPAPEADLAQPAPIASNFDTATLIGNPGYVPPSMAPDVVGAFRFLCGPAHLSYDDPIVFPGQPGAAHLHQFFGNTLADAHSTYRSLRETGDSTCQNKLNRSAYWAPALLDGKGHVVRVDYTIFYYKGDPAKARPLPPGMREIFGWNQLRPAEPFHVDWKCADQTGAVVNNRAYTRMADALAICPAGKQLFVTVNTPHCWDGKAIDSPDHRSHTAHYAKDPDTGVLACPASHPAELPQFTFTATYSIEAGDDTALWRFSSDHMLPGNVPGATFHVDAFLAWDPAVQATWHANCIAKMLSCSDGVLGDGTIMARGPFYPGSFRASTRLVPVPARP